MQNFDNKIEGVTSVAASQEQCFDNELEKFVFENSTLIAEQKTLNPQGILAVECESGNVYLLRKPFADLIFEILKVSTGGLLESDIIELLIKNCIIYPTERTAWLLGDEGQSDMREIANSLVPFAQPSPCELLNIGLTKKLIKFKEIELELKVLSFQELREIEQNYGGSHALKMIEVQFRYAILGIKGIESIESLRKKYPQHYIGALQTYRAAVDQKKAKSKEL